MHKDQVTYFARLLGEIHIFRSSFTNITDDVSMVLVKAEKGHTTKNYTCAET